MTGYNPINRIKIDLEKAGICGFCGMRFNDPNCTHATPEQIEIANQLDNQAESEDIFGHTKISEPEAQAAEIANAAAWLGNFPDEEGCGNDDLRGWITGLPEYREARRFSDNFDFNAVEEIPF